MKTTTASIGRMRFEGRLPSEGRNVLAMAGASDGHADECEGEVTARSQTGTDQ